MRSPFIKIPLFIIAAIGFVLAAGYLVMFLWNMIFPEVTSWGKLSYIQGLALFVLSKILFSGWGKGRGHWGRGVQGQHWREKWGQMNEEEREKWKAEWKKRCGKE